MHTYVFYGLLRSFELSQTSNLASHLTQRWFEKIGKDINRRDHAYQIRKKKAKHINNHNYKHGTKHLGNSNPSLTLIMTKFNTILKIKNLQTSLQTTLVLNEFSENLKRSCAYWNFKSILVCNKNLQQEQDFTKNLKRAQRG